MWNREGGASTARAFQRHPWLCSAVLPPFLGYGAFLMSGSWMRGLIVALITFVVVRFALGPYIVRLNREDRPES
jgi:hypothetical protein